MKAIYRSLSSPSATYQYVYKPLRLRHLNPGYPYTRTSFSPSRAIDNRVDRAYFQRHRQNTIYNFDWNRRKAMEKLEDIQRLSEHVVRILGQNPGKFTLQGTNTYLIGTSNPYILIDTGEGLPSYLPQLASALSQGRTDPSQPDVSDIVLSHWHHDHVGGLPSVLALLKDLWGTRGPSYTPPRLHKYPIGEGTQGGHATAYNQLPSILANLPTHLYTPPPSTNSNSVLHDLADGQVLSSHGVPLLRVLHTPGHTQDSICMYVPADRALYTADTVLGHGTAVFEDLALYLSSLNKMLHFGSGLNPSRGDEGEEDEIDLEYTTLYPAHGAPVSEGRETISTYIRHRLEREAQVLAVLRSPVPAHLVSESDNANANAESQAVGEVEDANGKTPKWTTWNVVRVIYQSYPENLWLPAARGIDLHLRKLEGEGVIKRVGDGGGEAQHAEWSLVNGHQSVVAPRSPSL